MARDTEVKLASHDSSIPYSCDAFAGICLAARYNHNPRDFSHFLGQHFQKWRFSTSPAYDEYRSHLWENALPNFEDALWDIRILAYFREESITPGKVVCGH